MRPAGAQPPISAEPSPLSGRCSSTDLSPIVPRQTPVAPAFPDARRRGDDSAGTTATRQPPASVGGIPSTFFGGEGTAARGRRRRAALQRSVAALQLTPATLQRAAAGLPGPLLPCDGYPRPGNVRRRPRNLRLRPCGGRCPLATEALRPCRPALHPCPRAARGVIWTCRGGRSAMTAQKHAFRPRGRFPSSDRARRGPACKAREAPAARGVANQERRGRARNSCHDRRRFLKWQGRTSD